MRGNNRFGYLILIVCITVMGCNFTAQTTPVATQAVTETEAPPEVDLTPTALIPTSTTAAPYQPVRKPLPRPFRRLPRLPQSQQLLPDRCARYCKT
jgi:hypothetical protein